MAHLALCLQPTAKTCVPRSEEREKYEVTLFSVLKEG